MKNNSDRGWRVVVTASVAFCMSAAASINAQSYRARVVYVVLEGCGMNLPSAVSLVQNGNESKSFPMERVGVSNVWKAEPHDDPYDANGRVGSLRTNRGRTGCVKSVQAPAAKAEEGLWISRYTFTCDFAPAWPLLTVDDNAEVSISTVRLMPEMPDTLPCKEWSLNRPSPRTIDAVAWRQESIYVHFGKPPGFYQYYDMMIRRDGMFAGKPIKDELVVTREDVLKELAVRGGRGIGNAASIRDLDKSVKTVTLKRVE